jgi:hypothetical protein
MRKTKDRARSHPCVPPDGAMLAANQNGKPVNTKTELRKNQGGCA